MLLTCNGLGVQNLCMGWSQKLKAAAGAKKLSGAAIGRALGYSATSANEWLRGETEPEFAILQPLCSLLGIQLAWLFDDRMSDDLTGPGLLACKLFSEVIDERGPYAAIALLEGSTQSARHLGGVTSPGSFVRNDKGTDREDPPSSVSGSEPLPIPSGGPVHLDFDQPPTRKGKSPRVPKRKR